MTRNPHIDISGRILNPIKAAAWVLEQHKLRRASNAPEAFHPVRDMPSCQWGGVHTEDSKKLGFCLRCGGFHFPRSIAAASHKEAAE